MKRFMTAGILVLALSFAVPSHGQDAADEGLYIGAGLTYTFENFDASDLEDEVGRGESFDNSYGFSGRIGYHFNRHIGLEFNYDYLPDFSWDQKRPQYIDAEVEVSTYMAVLKLSDKFYATRPFFAAGVGIMNAEVDAKFDRDEDEIKYNEEETDPCFKAGLGIDVFATDHISGLFQLDYVNGLGDVDDIRYVLITMGVAYHF